MGRGSLEPLSLRLRQSLMEVVPRLKPKLVLVLLLLLEPGSAAQLHVGGKSRSHSMSSSRWIRWLGGPWRGDGEEAKAVIAHVGTE